MLVNGSGRNEELAPLRMTSRFSRTPFPLRRVLLITTKQIYLRKGGSTKEETKLKKAKPNLWKSPHTKISHKLQPSRHVNAGRSISFISQNSDVAKFSQIHSFPGFLKLHLNRVQTFLLKPLFTDRWSHDELLLQNAIQLRVNFIQDRRVEEKLSVMLHEWHSYKQRFRHLYPTLITVHHDSQSLIVTGRDFLLILSQLFMKRSPGVCYPDLPAGDIGLYIRQVDYHSKNYGIQWKVQSQTNHP